MVLRAKVARSASRERKLCTGRPSSVRPVVCLVTPAGERRAFATTLVRRVSAVPCPCHRRVLLPGAGACASSTLGPAYRGTHARARDRPASDAPGRICRSTVLMQRNARSTRAKDCSCAPCRRRRVPRQANWCARRTAHRLLSQRRSRQFCGQS